MSSWATPLALILPIILQPLPIAIYRFFIHKKPVSKKKAKIISTVHTIVTYAFIGLISNQEAIIQAFCCIPLSLLNYAILLTTKERPLVRALLLNTSLWFVTICVCISIYFLITVIGGVSPATSTIAGIILILIYYFLTTKIDNLTKEFLINYSYSKNKDEVDSDRKF